MDSKLAPARDHVVRLQELVQLYKRLMDQDLVMFSDEVASARRRYQFYTGPRGISETLRKLRSGEEMCWRLRASDRRQAELSLTQLMEGLKKNRYIKGLPRFVNDHVLKVLEKKDDQTIKNVMELLDKKFGRSRLDKMEEWIEN